MDYNLIYKFRDKVNHIIKSRYNVLTVYNIIS